jgi:hypothetical protein
MAIMAGTCGPGDPRDRLSDRSAGPADRSPGPPAGSAAGHPPVGGSGLEFGGPVLEFGGAGLEFGGAGLEFGGAVLEFGGAVLEFGGAGLEFDGAVLGSDGAILGIDGAVPEIDATLDAGRCHRSRIGRHQTRRRRVRGAPTATERLPRPVGGLRAPVQGSPSPRGRRPISPLFPALDRAPNPACRSTLRFVAVGASGKSGNPGRRVLRGRNGDRA